MKKLHFSCILFLGLIFSACDESKSEAKYNEAKLFTYCDSFVSANPNPTKNDLIQRDIDKLFKSQIKSIFERDLFDDLLLSIQSVKEYQTGKYCVVLQRAKTDYDKRKVQFDIIALTDKETALVIDKRFLHSVKGQLLAVNPDSYYGLGFAFTPEVEIRKHSLKMGVIVIKNSQFIKSDKKFIK